MSQYIPVTTPLSPTLVATINTAFAAVQVLANTIVIPLNPSQTAGLIKVGPVKSAEISAISSQIMTPFPSTLPTGTTLTTFAALTLEEADSANLEATCLALSTLFGAHRKIISNNKMTIATQTLDNGKLQGKTNIALATSVNNIIDTYFSRSAPAGSTEYSAAISGTVTINGVKTEKMCVNFGFSIISVLNVGGSSNNAIKIFPNDGAIIPKSWVNVMITNLSATTEANFSLFMK